jgi:hypothetical protein
MAWLADAIRRHAAEAADGHAAGSELGGGRRGARRAPGPQQAGGPRKALSLGQIMRLVSEAAGSNGGGAAAAAAAAGQAAAGPGALEGVHITPQRVFAALLNLAHQSNTAAQRQQGGGKGAAAAAAAGGASTHVAWLPGCSVELLPGAGGGELTVAVLPA